MKLKGSHDFYGRKSIIIAEYMFTENIFLKINHLIT